MFPPVRSLIISPVNLYSVKHLADIDATLGENDNEDGEYPLSNLVDGHAGASTRWHETAFGVQLTLDAEYYINVVGIINHNLDPGNLIEVRLDNVLLPKTFSAQYPNCWLDLRAFSGNIADATSGVPATTIDLRCYGNSRRVAMAEVVVGAAYIFNGTIVIPYQENYGMIQRRYYTDHHTTLEWGTGVGIRTMTLNMQVPPPRITELESVTLWAGTDPNSRVVVIPSTRRNDIWLVRWPDVLPVTYPRSRQVGEVQLDLVEEAAGILA